MCKDIVFGITIPFESIRPAVPKNDKRYIKCNNYQLSLKSIGIYDKKTNTNPRTLQTLQMKLKIKKKPNIPIAQ